MLKNLATDCLAFAPMPMDTNILTVRELANRLSLGKTTVALALRESPLVNAATREWVRQQARELGYLPNTLASAFLQQMRSRSARPHRANLAFLAPARRGSFMKSLIEGAEERARELGYGLDVVRTTEFKSSNLMRVLLARGISGLIIGPLAHAAGHLTLNWSKFAVVSCGYSMVRPPVHRVVHNHFQGIQTAFRVCRRKGFRRIGLALSADSDLRSNRQWSSGFLGFQQTLPPAERIPPLLASFAEFTPKRIRQWIRRERPDVMIVHSAGCIPDLADLLESLSEPLPCVVLSREADEPYAGIDQQFKLEGKMLVDAVSSQILHNQSGLPKSPVVSSFEGLWVDHPSLVPPPARVLKKHRGPRAC